MQHGTAIGVNDCNDTGTIRFSNLTAKNIYVESVAGSAFEVGGYKTPSRQLQFVDFHLENFIARSFQRWDTAPTHRTIILHGAISAPFPRCTNTSAGVAKLTLDDVESVGLGL